MFACLKMLGNRALVYGLFFLMAVYASVGWASDEGLSPSDTHYLSGYFAHLQRQWAVCADEMFAATLDLPDSMLSQARLRLSDCQTNLKNLYGAAYNLNLVDSAALSDSDQLTYNRLKKYLSNYLAELDHTWFQFSPYYGAFSFSPQVLKKGGSFIGLGFQLVDSGWRLDLGVEALQMELTSAVLSPYSQVLFQAGGGKEISAAWDVHYRLAFLVSPDSSQNSITAMTAGWSYGSTSTRLHMDTSYSNYPSSYMGTMNVLQQTAALKQNLLSSGSFGLWSQVGADGVLPSASTKSNTLINFTMEPFYYRFALDLGLYWGALSWVTSASAGREAFAVRNEGAIVFSFPELRLGSVGTVLSYPIANNFTLMGSYQREFLVISGTSAFGDTFTGLLNIGL